MNKFSHVQKSTRTHWLVVGIVLSLAVIGVDGCGTKDATSSPATSSTQSASPSTTDATTSSQQTQGQTALKPDLNPAIEAAMSIRRLQDNQQTVLTSDQKATIKPILQTLIDTSSPSQDFLQQKADAISAVFTDAQKTYLSTNTQKDKPDGNGQKGQEPPKDQTNEQNRAPSGNQTAPSGQSQDIFKQVLASLT
jgi:hypothetical protein